MRQLSWNAPEYVHTPKTAEWFFAFGIISIALIATAALLGNFLFVGVLVLASLALLFYSNRAPDFVVVSIEQNGIRFGERFYQYEKLAGFWVEENANDARLLLKQSQTISFLISIPIENIHPNLVRSAVKDYLPEEVLKEPFAQKLMEFLGF